MSNQSLSNQEAIEKVRDLIKGIDTAMLTTVTEQGLVSRPMKTQEVEFDGDLWFLTKKDTNKYQELLRNRSVNVAYVDKSYVSLRGEAELVSSPAKIKEFWNIAYEKLLETTPDDPNLVLIKIKAESAEYWETGSKTKMVKQLFSKITGKGSDESNLNQTVDLNG
ncbi:pyridoxamine 5'-phosphate oxidase family protein [Paenibacillus crassostreae]|uniref:General stress protein n=1 Tax=Paenibacillus crassostreae TaxID=1763538 RepID=A0A167F9P4_9BACL|nr:pyridoxamine 5'-phosphate oxidase family protein [Paenibacillus crassostreae]AOZ90901.1 general stress protein [Paenibacillus crassostreae]OAB76332.1 general stress protein [Paenibacillus crassostreae]